jgi:hypothetical protein
VDAETKYVPVDDEWAWQPAAAMSRPTPLAGCWPTSNPGRFDSVKGTVSSISWAPRRFNGSEIRSFKRSRPAPGVLGCMRAVNPREFGLFARFTQLSGEAQGIDGLLRRDVLGLNRLIYRGADNMYFISF